MVMHPTVTIDGAPADPSLIARPLTVVHGRAGIDTQADPPTAEILWCDPVMPWQLGAAVTIASAVPYLAATYDDPVATYDDPRVLYSGAASEAVEHFAGQIDSMEAVEILGQVQEWRIGCVGRQARWGRYPVKVTRPQENDVQRAAAISAAAGGALRMFGTAQVALAAADLDGDALSLLQDVCESSGALLYQSRHGDLTYEAADYRVDGNPKPLGVIPASDVLDGVVWQATADDIINDITVTYGANLTAHYTDAASQAEAWGVRHTDIATGLALLADADILAQLVLARRGFPFWRTGTNLLDLLSEDTLRLFSRLDISSAVMVPWPTDPGPTPSALTPVVVEGWIETWAENLDHTAEVAFSDQHRWVLTTTRSYSELLTWGEFTRTYSMALSLGTYSDLLIQEA